MTDYIPDVVIKRALDALFETMIESVLTAAHYDELLGTLQEVAEFLEGQADVNWEGDGPNKAMSLLNEVNEAIAKATGRPWP